MRNNSNISNSSYNKCKEWQNVQMYTIERFSKLMNKKTLLFAAFAAMQLPNMNPLKQVQASEIQQSNVVDTNFEDALTERDFQKPTRLP